jgi:hypothetical protein
VADNNLTPGLKNVLKKYQNSRAHQKFYVRYHLFLWMKHWLNTIIRKKGTALAKGVCLLPSLCHLGLSQLGLTNQWNVTLPPSSSTSPTPADQTRNAESTEWFVEGPAFSRSYDLAPRPPLASVSSIGDAQEDWERETTCWWEREGRGRAWSRIIRRQECLALYESFYTLWRNALLLNTPYFNWSPQMVVICFFSSLLVQLYNESPGLGV